MNSPKAPLLKRMNVLKKVADESLLTPAQEEARQAITDHQSDGASFINLHGPRHAGKTFLSWVLRDGTEGVYYQALPNNPDGPTVIYDHGEPERRATRQLRNHASIHQLETVVYVTERPAEELYPRVELRPGDTHYDLVAERWEELGLKTDAAPKQFQK